MAESNQEAVDAACQSMTTSWLLKVNRRQPGPFKTCHYNYNFQAARENISIPSGVYDLEELQKRGKFGWCFGFCQGATIQPKIAIAVTAH